MKALYDTEFKDDLPMQPTEDTYRELSSDQIQRLVKKQVLPNCFIAMETSKLITRSMNGHERLDVSYLRDQFDAVMRKGYIKVENTCGGMHTINFSERKSRWLNFFSSEETKLRPVFGSQQTRALIREMLSSVHGHIGIEEATSYSAKPFRIIYTRKYQGGEGDALFIGYHVYNADLSWKGQEGKLTFQTSAAMYKVLCDQSELDFIIKGERDDIPQRQPDARASGSAGYL